MEISAPACRPVLVLGLVAGLLTTGLVELASRAPTAAVRPVAAVVPAIDVLHEWDRRRAAAYAEGDVRALARLYAPRSTAARADVALLRAYLRRGLTVDSLTMQVFSVQVLTRRDGELTMRVVDRIAGGNVIGRSRCKPMPRDFPARHEMELHRVGGDWRVARVADV
jgi:hypothetical protein